MDTTITLPSCPEDATLIGVGDFTHGHWEAYACGPSRDDYSATAGLLLPDTAASQPGPDATAVVGVILLIIVALTLLHHWAFTPRGH